LRLKVATAVKSNAKLIEEEIFNKKNQKYEDEDNENDKMIKELEE
jgi:hypothetical protein